MHFVRPICGEEAAIFGSTDGLKLAPQIAKMLFLVHDMKWETILYWMLIPFCHHLVWNPPLLYPRYSYQMHILIFLALWGLKWIDNLKGACSCKTCWFQPGQVNLIFKKQDYGNGGEMFPISWNQFFFTPTWSTKEDW